MHQLVIAWRGDGCRRRDVLHLVAVRAVDAVADQSRCRTGLAVTASRSPLRGTWWAVLGGITLGAVMALLAAAASAAGLSSTEALGIGAVLAVLAAACDSHVVGFGPPFFRRQVNEGWLVSLRGWVYGLGFGWQVGAGVTTYIMTTAVFLTIALGALSASPAAALALGTLFGLARGLAAFSPGRATTVEALFAFHRRFDALAPVVRRGDLRRARRRPRRGRHRVGPARGGRGRGPRGGVRGPLAAAPARPSGRPGCRPRARPPR